MSSEVTAEKAKNAKYEQEIEDLRSHVAELEKLEQESQYGAQ